MEFPQIKIVDKGASHDTRIYVDGADITNGCTAYHIDRKAEDGMAKVTLEFSTRFLEVDTDGIPELPKFLKPYYTRREQDDSETQRQ